MVDVCWSARGGWHRPRVQPYGPITLDPAAAVLHYGQEIFEGIKAYRHADGSIWTFRPEQNAAPPAALAPAASRCRSCRASTSSSRSRELIAVDGDWVPSGADESLYLRPFMFAKEAFLGVRPAQKVAYYLIASPAGAYFHGGVKPVSIWLSDGLRARRQGRHRRGEDRRQLRREPAAAVRGRTSNGCDQVAVPRPGGQVRRRARRHERGASSTRTARS